MDLTHLLSGPHLSRSWVTFVLVTAVPVVVSVLGLWLSRRRQRHAVQRELVRLAKEVVAMWTRLHADMAAEANRPSNGALLARAEKYRWRADAVLGHRGSVSALSQPRLIRALHQLQRDRREFVKLRSDIQVQLTLWGHSLPAEERTTTLQIRRTGTQSPIC
jgi:hypothetical protein